jgi:hypothetical protein
VSGNTTNKITREEFFKNVPDMEINDKIIHAGDTNTAIRFPAADTVTVETSGAERLRITSAGDVGIGITPSYDLHVKQGGDSYTFGLESDGDDSRFLVGEISSTWRIAATYGSTGSFMPITFFTSDTERARIDSDGNLLVGTTSQYGSQKLSLNGGIAIDGRSAVTPGLSEKGDDNTGVFWPAADSLGFSTGGTERARIDSSGNLLVGTTTSPSGSGQIVANGGVYLGGTGSANLLDDYEEGTWTPVFSQSGATISHAGTGQVGFYTKIGRLVHVSGRIETLSWSGGSGAISISGLPFSSITTSPSTDAHTASIGVTFGGWSSTDAPRTGFMDSGETSIRLFTSDSSDARSQMDTAVTSVGDGSVGLIFNIVYTST